MVSAGVTGALQKKAEMTITKFYHLDTFVARIATVLEIRASYSTRTYRLVSHDVNEALYCCDAFSISLDELHRTLNLTPHLHNLPEFIDRIPRYTQAE